MLGKRDWIELWRQRLLNRWYLWRYRYYNFLTRRPHRSFRRTRRRDYRRSLRLPGYFAFVHYVNRILRENWRTFLAMILIYALAMFMLGVATNQTTYDSLGELLTESMSEIPEGEIGKIGEAGLLVLASFAIDPTSLSAEQFVMMALCLLLTWLTTVWLLREILLGYKPKLRDGLYNSGAPIVSTAIVLMILLVQLLPLGVMALIYSGLSSVNLLSGGFGAMIFSLLLASVAALVLYWITSTILALVVVALPGMYPLSAMKAAGDLVVGRRLRILYRLIFAFLCVLISWSVLMIASTLLERWLSSMWDWLKNVPIVPGIGAFLMAAIVVWLAAYVYLLYRKVVDDDAKSA